MPFEVENGEETGLCPAGAKQNGTCDPINQGEMCAFGLGKVLVEIEMLDTKDTIIGNKNSRSLINPKNLEIRPCMKKLLGIVVLGLNKLL